jgi:hypothetical protein
MASSRFKRALASLHEQRDKSENAKEITDEALQHQATQVATAVHSLLSDHPRILRDPVGTGKTAVALTTARLLLDEGVVDYVLLVAPNKLVANQWFKRAEVPFGVARRMNSKKWQPKVLRIVTHHTVPAGPSPDPMRTLVIVDEAHRGLQRSTDVYKDLLTTAAGAKLLLVSATPFQMSTAGLTSMLRLGTGIDEHDAHALATYGRSVTAVLRAFDRDPKSADVEQAADVADHLKDAAATALQSHLLPQTKMTSQPPPDLKFACIPLGSWATAYHVARVLPELVGKGKNDSFQRGLVSSSETVWNNPVMGDTLDKLLGGSDPDICAFLEMLDARLGHGIDHPKVKATTDWVVSQVHEGHHVIVFTVWKQTQKTLHETLAKRLGDDTVTGPVKGTIPDVFQKRVSEPPDGSPVVLVLTDRFSESIDLDGGCPSLVHHDLSWNPVRVTQRWGRVVRVRTGFEPIPPERIYIPVLDTEVDRRVARTVRGRTNLVSLMVPAAEGNDAWHLPDVLLKQISTAAE